MPLSKKQKGIINNEVTLHQTRLMRAKDASSTAREMDALRGRLHQRFSELQKNHERREAKISKQNSPESSMKNMLERCVENLLAARIAELSLTKSIIETGGHSQSNLRTALRITEKATDFNNHLIRDMKTVERDTERGHMIGTLGPDGLRGLAPLTPREVETAEKLFRTTAPLNQSGAVFPSTPSTHGGKEPVFLLYALSDLQPPRAVSLVPPSTQTEAAPLPAPLEVGEDVTPKV